MTDTPDALAARLAAVSDFLNSYGRLVKAETVARDAIAALRSATEKPNTVRADPSPSVDGGDSHRAAVALKPCPFCGGDAAFGAVANEDGNKDAGGEFIMCNDPACHASTLLVFPTMTDAKPLLVEKWNRRAPTPPTVTEQPRAATETAAAVDGPLLMETLCVHGYERCPACAALAAVPQQGQPQEPVTPVVAQWMPISTAPKPTAEQQTIDMLIWSQAYGVCQIEWYGDLTGYWQTKGVTHWMPLPAPPLPETPPTPTETARVVGTL